MKKLIVKQKDDAPFKGGKRQAFTTKYFYTLAL